jgi:lysozyme family protein
MLENRQKCLDWVFEEEGGFVVRLTEPGGAGNLGISFQVFSAWMALHGSPHATLDDLENMTKELAGTIYAAEWMTPLRFNELANGIDYALFDASVNLGVGGGIRMLQLSVLGMMGGDVTGHMDAVTMAALMALSKAKTVALMINGAWLARKKLSPEWPRFGKGWSARAQRVRNRLLMMAP